MTSTSSKDKKHLSDSHLSDSIRVLAVHVKDSWVSGLPFEHTERLIRLSQGLISMLVIWYFHVPQAAGKEENFDFFSNVQCAITVFP